MYMYIDIWYKLKNLIFYEVYEVFIKYIYIYSNLILNR